MAAAAASPASDEEQLGFFDRLGRIVAPVEAPLPPPVPPSQSLLGSLAQYVAPDPTAAAADGEARIEEGVEESKSTEPPVSLRLDNCTVSRAAERLLIELATDLAAAPDADPAERCRAYLNKHYPAPPAS